MGVVSVSSPASSNCTGLAEALALCIYSRTLQLAALFFQIFSIFSSRDLNLLKYGKKEDKRERQWEWKCKEKAEHRLNASNDRNGIQWICWLKERKKNEQTAANENSTSTGSDYCRWLSFKWKTVNASLFPANLLSILPTLSHIICKFIRSVTLQVQLLHRTSLKGKICRASTEAIVEERTKYNWERFISKFSVNIFNLKPMFSIWIG